MQASLFDKRSTVGFGRRKDLHCSQQLDENSLIGSVLMRFSISKWLGSISVVALVASTAFAQFTVREMNLEGQQVAGHYQAYLYATSEADQAWLEDSGFAFIEDVEDFKEELDYVNIGGNNGWFHDGNGTPLENGGFALGDDYIIDARAEVEIPAGTWTISFNTDDGGQITMPGANFFGGFRINDPFGKGSADQFWFAGNRGHQATGASFTVPEGETLTTLLHASMHERGGGDSIEVTIRPGGPGNNNPRPGQADWVLLEDGAHGWSVSPTDDLPERGLDGFPVAGGGGDGGAVISPSNGAFPLGNLTPTSAAVINTTGDGADFSAGLEARWYEGDISPRVLTAALAKVGSNDEFAKFQNEQTWWAGNNAATHSAFQLYPEEIDGINDRSSEADNNQYTAWLSGEINLPEGDTVFRVGVDDYKYFALDTGGNGVAGDQPGEVLMDDNVWVQPGGTRGNGSFPNPVVASSENGGWTKIEFIMAEGGGGDSGMLYWDANSDDDFPLAAPFREDIGFIPEDYAVPSDALRSVERGDVESIELRSAFDGATLNLEVSSAFRDSDRINLSDDNFTTEINLAGATVNITALDGEELVAGDQWVLFNADSVVGFDEATFNLEGGADMWDLSGLIAGTTNRITYMGEGGEPTCADIAATRTPGDADGVNGVDFIDFLAFAANFGQAGGYAEGDFNCSGDVEFLDFLILAENFGAPSAAAAAAVPEPSSALLIGMGAMLLGLARRRRS